MTRDRIGVAVVGTGFMGWVHVEALRRIGVTIVGVCGSSPAKSKAAAEEFGLSRAYDSYEDVLADEEVHSVHIGTPNRWHFPMAKSALLAGKHVMCEKPLAMTSAESAELVRVASEHSQLAAGVNYNLRFYPLCLEVGQRIRRGTLGDVVHVTGSYVQEWLTLATDYNWRVLARENGELRAIADIGTHWLDLVQSMTGLEVEAVLADLKTVHPVRYRPSGEVESFSGGAKQEATEPVSVTTEDYGAVLLRFRGGARGCMHVSQVAPGRKNCLRFEIAGSHETLAWNSERPNQLWIGHCDRPNEELLRDPALLTGPAQAAAAYPGGHNEGYADSFKQCFRAFYDTIAEGGVDEPATYPTFADGHREVQLCEAILASHRAQQWTAVGEPG
ncbi:1,5-anhydro-D-fructose reductase [Planctomycetes bacterium Pan216]|uniref:1,5-anhydro-D-fructose reductase n=1 Tax=Kolteria novifilia TaxID=2527975 RepID=A0A518B7U2_9BACT|nr:1,5-anhydro-D-fructose reductase [Planctomycetes bacterium Pan216]